MASWTETPETEEEQRIRREQTILHQLWRTYPKRKGKSINKFLPAEIQRAKDVLNKSAERFGLHRRYKRFVGVALAGAAVVGTLGTFLGLYTAIEMKSLRRALSELQDQQCLLVQVTNEHDIRLKEMASDLVRITDVIELFIKNNPTVLFAQLEEQIDLLAARMQQAMQVVQQLQHRRMAVDFLSGEQLLNMHQELQAMAKSQDLTLLPVQMSDYFQLECSWLRQGEDLLIMLHVPCVHQKHMLKIYKYIPYPFPLPSKVEKLDHPISHVLYNGSFVNDAGSNFRTPDYPEGLFVEPEAEFIATGMDQQYKLLTNAELALCDKHSRVLLCNEHQVLRTSLEDTCMGALFTRSETAAQERCKFIRRRLEETVHQLSTTNHLVYSPESFTTTVKCKNGTHAPLFLSEGNNRIHVPRGCQAELRRHLITSDFDIQVTPEPLSTIWKWDPLHLSASLLTDAIRADKQLFALHQRVAELQSYSQEPNKMQQHFASYLRDYNNYPIGWWLLIAGIAALVLTGAVIHCCRKYGCCDQLNVCCNALCIPPSRGPPGRTPPPHRRTRSREPIVRYVTVPVAQRAEEVSVPPYEEAKRQSTFYPR